MISLFNTELLALAEVLQRSGQTPTSQNRKCRKIDTSERAGAIPKISLFLFR